MTVKNSILLGTLGRYADRFHEYQPAASLTDRLDMAAAIPRADGVEPVYPQDLGKGGEHVGVVRDCRLPVSAVNVNIKTDAEFRRGALTSRDPEVRRLATDYIKRGMDLAVELGTDMVSVCPLIDGWDHAFEVDYDAQWGWLLAGFKDACAHRDDVRISIEYKPFEVRNHIALPTMARTLLLCEEVASPRLGVTMDVGHALIAGETPAAELCLAHRTGRLFYVHFNDNDRNWDWDTMPGSVNFWETLEAAFYVRRLGWSGWFAYDVFTRKGDPAEALGATLEVMELLEEFIDKVGIDALEDMLVREDPAPNYAALMRSML